MNLLHIVVEASKTGDRPRLNKPSAENVIRAIADWLEQNDDWPYRDDVGCWDRLRSELSTTKKRKR